MPQQINSGPPPSNQSPDICFVIPCYKEPVDVVQRTVNGIRDAIRERPAVKAEITVVDDGSGGNRYVKVSGVDRLLVHPTNRGYGGSIKTGIQNTLCPKIAITDADDTYNSRNFVEMIDLSREYDMVIGSRPWSAISPLRRIPKKMITWFAAYVAGARIPDLNSGMRIFNRQIYEAKRGMFPDAFSFSSTLTMVSLTQNFTTKFVDIHYGKRTGRSKIRPIKDTLRFSLQLLRLSLYFQPLKVFMPLSGLLLVAASARGARDYLVGGQLGGVCLVLFFMSFQVFFFGLIAEIINKK